MARKTVEIGARFGLLVVLRKIPAKPHQDARTNYYELQCDCGNLATSDAYMLDNGSRSSCGCRKGNWYDEPLTTRFGAKHHYGELRKSASKRKLVFEITEEQYRDIFSKPCAYCATDKKVSVDRIDNAVGYLPENVQPCCKVCNQMKHAMTHQDFVEHLRRIANALGLG